MNARRVLLLVVILLALTITPGAAQGNIEILVPVHGMFAAQESRDENQIYRVHLIDSYTGETTTLDYNQAMLSSVLPLSPNGDQLAISSRQLSVFSIWSRTDNLVLEYTLEGAQLYEPVGWSSDGQGVLLISYTQGAPGTKANSLSRFDRATGTQTTLLTFSDGESITGFSLPAGISQLQFLAFNHVNVNPVYDDWLLIQIRCINPLEVGSGDGRSVPETAYVNLTVLWNQQTGTTLSLNDFLGSNIGGSASPWYPDGQRLYLTTYSNQQYADHLIHFDPVSGSLEDIDGASDSPATMLFWLGAGNLMIGIRPEDDAGQAVYYLAELQDSGWYSTEFMRLETRVAARDWRFTASEDERRQLSCLFDQTLPSQLSIGMDGQVAFTDGTPSRLRSAPDLYSAQVTMMAEGTPFTVLDGPTCMDGYRWWQLRLGDGTLGWAAEADTAGYFLEPRP